MKIYTDNGPAMAAAIDKIFGFSATHVEGMTFNVANECSPEYQGGTWAFVTNDEGTVGFWYPTDRPAYAVSVADNYFSHDAMDAESFGAACTLVGLNRLLWRLHAAREAPDALIDTFHALRDWIFDLGEHAEPFIDPETVAAFID